MADPFTPYETGVNRLLEQLGRDHRRYAEVLTLETQLRENVSLARLDGDSETRRADRNRIVRELNRLALEAVGVSFNELSGQEVDVGQGTTTPPEKFTRLRENLVRHFDGEELRTLCADLGVDYDSLRGEGKEGKARELIAYLDRRGRIPELIEKCRALRTQVDWEQTTHVPPPGRSKEVTSPPPAKAFQPAHLFICYKRNVEPDQTLAHYLYEFLTAQGHEVFIDGTLRTGEAWLEEIDRQIKASDFLVVLLSKASADSEMVKAEVSRAYEYRKQQGKPQTLPVRIAYEEILPYSIAAFVDPLQYVVWQGEADNERVAHDILSAIEGRLPKRVPVQIKSVTGGLINDGRVIADDGTLHPPLSEFDPRILEELEAPGGAVKLRDRFYVEREADAHLKREVVKPGTTTTIRAARQTGKSSLLVRGVHHAREHGTTDVCLDLQGVDQDYLETPDVFMRYLAEFTVRKLRLNVAEVEKLWCSSLGPQDRLTCLMEDYVLSTGDTPIVLALDEADRLLQTAFYQDFFALVRAWHNSRASDERWNRLNVVMVISTEPYLLIPDVNQSPFNVGLNLYLKDFDAVQVRDLNQRHGSPVTESDFPRLMELLGGHPYLTRKALYTLTIERWTWADLMRVAATDQGPFGDHLRHHHWLLRDKRDLREELRQIIRYGRCTDENAFFRLLRAGLVKGSGDVCRCRCDLYRMYFKDKLR
jgi:hypothetical protein